MLGVGRRWTGRGPGDSFEAFVPCADYPCFRPAKAVEEQMIGCRNVSSARELRATWRGAE